MKLIRTWSLRRFSDKTSFCVLSLIVIAVLIPGSTLAQQDNPRLKYGWKKGEKYGYEFDVSYEIDGDTRTSTGFVTYELEKKNVAKNLSGKPLGALVEGEATSTAFGITSDGYLLTCAHCVEGAKTINVRVGDESLPATVIDVDEELDLAIIKVESTDLPTVVLGKNKQVELAQDVRVIGYPLSDVLGRSVKIAKGSIAGFIKEEHKTTLQIDVAVNPGNSGGPLIDETGSVVGVVNAKISGKEISKIGFAVPIELAISMLDEHKIKYNANVTEKTLSGPELARKLIPAVFFVESEIGPGGPSHAANYQFSINGSMKRMDSNGRKTQVIAQGKSIIAGDGHLLDSNDDTQLPLGLGSICQLPIEILSRNAAKTWTRAEHLMIPLPKSRPKSERRQTGGLLDPFGRHGFPGLGQGFGPGFGPRLGPGGFGRRETRPAEPEMRIALGQQKTTYKIVNREADLVTISATFELKTIDGKSEFADLNVNHESTLVFDQQRGIFISKKLTGQLELRLGTERLKIPLKLNYRQIDLETFLNPGIAKSDDNKKMVPKTGLTAEQIDHFVTVDPKELKSLQLLTLLNRLADWDDAQTRRPEIVAAIKSVLDSNISGTTKPAIDALLKWEKAEATPFVIEELDKANAFSKKSWIIKLGRTQHPDAAEVLCRHLLHLRTRGTAKAALVQFGATGEQFIIETLNKNALDEGVAEACLDVLGKLGAQASIEAIEGLLDQPEWKSKPAAEQSISKIRRRIE